MMVSNLREYFVPLDERKQILFFSDWQSSHIVDHDRFYKFINNILDYLNRPLMKPHKFNFGFDPRDIGTVNLFLKINDSEHKEIYRKINEIGNTLTPIFYVQPVLNMTMALNYFERGAFAKMLFHESRVHLLTARALNLLAEACRYVP
jgi:hypothetical protein